MSSAPPQSITWFARHELLLAGRDRLSMMTAGKHTRERAMLVFVALFVVGLHLLAVEVRRLALVEGEGLVSSKVALVLVAATDPAYLLHDALAGRPASWPSARPARSQYKSGSAARRNAATSATARLPRALRR